MRSRIKTYLALVAAPVIFASILVFEGCSKSDSASSPGSILASPMHSPLSAWAGLQQAMAESNVQAWASALTVDFRYYPDSVAAEKYPGVYADWSRASEEAFVQRLFSGELLLVPGLVPSDFEPPATSGTTIEWDSVEYWVRVSSPAGESPVEYRGVAALEFRLEAGFWYLNKWTDLRGGSAEWNPEVVLPTLGELRALYRR